MKIINSTHYPMLEENIVKAKGVFVYNENHKRFYDLESGVWCLPLGHNNEMVNSAIIQQLSLISHIGYLYSNQILEDAKEKLCQISGISQANCVFLSSGSEAVEYAIQLARTIHPNRKGARINQAYISAYGSGKYTNTDWIELNQDLSEIDFEEIGYIVLEPGNHSGKVKKHDRNWIKTICDNVKKHNGLVIIDEVTTGIGRTGKWFGYMHYDICPDIISCGKGLGNGYPVSAVIVNQDIFDQAMSLGFGYAQSHQNDPMGARVVLTVLEEIESKNLINETAVKGNYLTKQLQKISSDRSEIKEIRAIGLMIAVEFDETISIEHLEKLHHYMHQNGYLIQIIPARRLMRLYPPLIITTSEMDDVLSGITDGLNQVFDK